MPRKTLETMSEPMFYVLMALRHAPLCGTEIAAWVAEKTEGVIRLGPGTLYTILGKLTEEDMLTQSGETPPEGRKRSYSLTDKGNELYSNECRRLRRCVRHMDEEERV